MFGFGSGKVESPVETTPTKSMASRIADRRQSRALERVHGNPRNDELRMVRDRIWSDYQARITAENKAHRDKLCNMKPTIDDDTEDDATGEARARLKVEAAERRVAAEVARKAVNVQYFAYIRAAQAVTDTKIWDDGVGSAGAMRSVVAAKKRAIKKAEAIELARKNKELADRLKQVKAMTDNDVDEYAQSSISSLHARGHPCVKAVYCMYVDSLLSSEEAGRARVRMKEESLKRKQVASGFSQWLQRAPITFRRCARARWAGKGCGACKAKRGDQGAPEEHQGGDG